MSQKTNTINAALEAVQPMEQLPIEKIGEEPRSTTNQRILPVYKAHGHIGKWSGKETPPMIGSRVQINFNQLGSGEVINYFSESGFLGVLVNLDHEPEWRKKQSAAGKPAMVFGSEISAIN